MVNTLFRELVKPLPKTSRLLFLDYSRGIALIFMIYSHALRNFASRRWYSGGDFLEFQHLSLLIVKTAPPLFIMIFGFLIAYVFTDKSRTFNMVSITKKFCLKAGIIFVAYRICAFFESSGRNISYHFFSVGDTHWIEILLFYVILLLMTPFIILIWKKIPSILFILISVVLIAFSLKISQAGYNNQFIYLPKTVNLVFFGLKGHYNFPIFPYIGIYFIGFLLGFFYRICETHQKINLFTLLISVLSICLVLYFYLMGHDRLIHHFVMIKNNVYKHPPNFYYLLYSVAGAIVILSSALVKWMYFDYKGSFISDLGTRPLFLFVTHFFLIFIVFRPILGRLYTQPIGKALTYTCFTLVLCHFSLKVWNLIVQLIYQERSKLIQNAKPTD